MREVRAEKKVVLGWPGGDVPGEPGFSVQLPEVRRRELLAAIQNLPLPIGSALDIKALTVPETFAGRYRLQTKEESFFVKIGQLAGNPSLEKRLGDFLEQNGVTVNPLLYSGYVTDCAAEQYRIDLRPFIKGRHYNNSLEDLARLVAGVQKMHEALRRFDHTDEVRSAAGKRNRELAGIHRRLKEELAASSFQELFGPLHEWAAAHAGQLSAVAASGTFDWHERGAAQCLHGELHAGNVIFCPTGAVLLDFEEAVHVYAPPLWDLAYLVQRFCLADYPEPSLLARRIEVIRREYGPLPLDGLAAMMQEIACFALCVLLDLRINRQLICPQNEYEKFIRLHQQAASLQPL
jgi:hypothetical protein